MDNLRGWEMVRNCESLLEVFDCFPSFHDSAVRTFCLKRGRTERGPSGKLRELVDLELEILHNRYGPPKNDGIQGHLIMLELLDITSSEIDVNVMLEAAWIADVRFSRTPDDLIRFDLMPNIGLDIQLTCRDSFVRVVRPYTPDEV
ncbi:immunity 50 family protein [Caballeronia sp. Sq4a]|uniref:immunity 50 family protein n=1 Tax=Caballeronia sp. Sq4a TaxID=2878152 RepID=UPI0020BFBB59|nr:immunity 50 family protein [Caballeronia sp. Sq4a]